MTARDTLDLARAAYREIALYAPDRAPCAVDLSDNTNLFGLPPAADAALRTAATAAVTRYPALYAGELKAALASYVGVRPDQVVTGCGSDDVLDSAIRAVAEPGDLVAWPDPSFAMIPIFARMNGLVPVAVPLRDDLAMDADAVLATGARVIYLCSPNNPTASRADGAAIERIIERAPGLVILDEAYAEFMGDGMPGGFAADAPRHDRLLVVRTMSKAFGLAGLRIGYATGSPGLIAAVEKSRGPYKVSALAERAALAALSDGPGGIPWVRDRVADVLELRGRFSRAAAELGAFRVLPSAANFVLLVHEAPALPPAMEMARRLRIRGVAVRPFTGLRGIGSALRVTIGPWSMMTACLDALRAELDALGIAPTSAREADTCV